MMTVTCTIDGESLRLEREVYDDIDRVYVGTLICPVCGRWYMDQRKKGESRPEQLTLPELT